MIPPLCRTCLITSFAALALGAAIAQCAQPLPGPSDDNKTVAPDAPKQRLDPQALQAEVAAQKEGIHKLSDDSICIKSGPGMAIISPDGFGCSTGSTAPPAQVEDGDIDLMAGVFHALILTPDEGKKLGITGDRANKIKDAYNYMDNANTIPTGVTRLYADYQNAADGQTKTDAEKALMDKVHAIGQAFADADAKKLKDVKALLSADETKQLKAIGVKMIHPTE